MILAKKRHVIECQCEMCGQEFDISRVTFHRNEEAARYCPTCCSLVEPF